MNPRKKFKLQNSNSNCENEGPVSSVFDALKTHSPTKTNHRHSSSKHPRSTVSPGHNPSQNNQQQKSNNMPLHYYSNFVKRQLNFNTHHHYHQQQLSPQHHNKNVLQERESVNAESSNKCHNTTNVTSITAPTPNSSYKNTRSLTKKSPPPPIRRSDNKFRSSLDRATTPAADFASPKSFNSPNATEVPLPPTHWFPATYTCSRELLSTTNISAQLKSLLNVA